MSKAIKILFLAPDPTNVVYRPRLGEEFREIERELRTGSHREFFKLASALAVRPDDLQYAFLTHKPDVVHLSGHGSKDALLLEDRDGKIKPVPKATLIELFGLFNNQIRLVVFNSCHSQSQLEALKETIDYTIAMNEAVQDETAIAFARAFYRALASGEPVARSFRMAINQLGLSSIAGADIPQLFVKPGVDIAKPFFDSAEGQSVPVIDASKRRFWAIAIAAAALVLMLAVLGWRRWVESTKAPRTLSYWALLQKYHDGIPVGNPVPLSGGVSGEAAFALGDAITFFFISPQEGHLYVINEETRPQAPSSSLRIVFPSPESDPPSSEILAGEQVFTSELRFDENKGTERLWVICTDEAYPQLEEAIQMSANDTHRGLIEEAAAVAFVRNLLSRSVPSTRVSRDTINSGMIVESKGRSLVYLVKLIHR